MVIKFRLGAHWVEATVDLHPDLMISCRDGREMGWFSQRDHSAGLTGGTIDHVHAHHQGPLPRTGLSDQHAAIAGSLGGPQAATDQDLFLSRTPGPSPFASIKMTPAVSSALRMARRLAGIG